VSATAPFRLSLPDRPPPARSTDLCGHCLDWRATVTVFPFEPCPECKVAQGLPLTDGEAESLHARLVAGDSRVVIGPWEERAS